VSHSKDFLQFVVTHATRWHAKVINFAQMQTFIDILSPTAMQINCRELIVKKRL
jgi:hypothetical protein